MKPEWTSEHAGRHLFTFATPVNALRRYGHDVRSYTNANAAASLIIRRLNDKSKMPKELLERRNAAADALLMSTI